MSHTTVALFKNRTDAENTIQELKQNGVNEAEISYIYVTGDGDTEVKDGSGAITSKAVADGAVGGAATGAVVGALAGLAVVTGILPGLGALMVAGPLATALGLTGAAATTTAGAMTGAAAGGLVGALVGFGATDEDARMYESRVKQGDILVATATPLDVKAVFERHNPEEIREYVK